MQKVKIVLPVNQIAMLALRILVQIVQEHITLQAIHAQPAILTAQVVHQQLVPNAHQNIILMAKIV